MRIKIRRKYLFYALAFSSAIIAAINSGVDATVSEIHITNPWAMGLAIFILGIPVSILFGLIFSIPYRGKSLGARIADPSFKRLRLIRKNELLYQLISGFGNATYTVGYFALFVIVGDPSVVLPFTQIVILYLVAIESINEKDMPTLSEVQSILIVTFGAVLGSISFRGNLSLEALAIVFIVLNPSWALLTIYQRKLKWLKHKNVVNDSINIRIWNVVFACFFTIIIVLAYDFFMDTNHLMEGIHASIYHIEWAALIAVGAFFAFIFYIRALGIGKASVVTAVRSSTIIFSIPVSLFIAYLGIIEPFSMDPTLLLIKFIGIVIMILGILSFALNLVKAYIFINLKPGYNIEQVMDELWKLSGVTHVCAVAGEYDLIIKIRTRALVKGYEKIVKKIEEIKAIENFKWESVLKEWEDI